MDKCHFLVVDTETGGLDYKKHAILEIGAAIFNEEGKKLEEFHAILPPDEKKTQTLYALKLNKWTKRNAEINKTRPIAAKDFSDWLISVSEKYNPTLVGQNLNFDIRFLNEFMEEHGFEEWNGIFGFHHIDTILLGKALQITGMIKTKKLALGSLAEEFKIVNTNAHTAMADIETTAQVLIHMLKLMSKE